MDMSAYECTNCGKVHHPQYTVCQQCGHREFKEIPLGGKAKLLTYTRVFNLPEGYMKPWLNFGILEFENGVRVSGQVDCDDLETGMELVSTVDVVKEGVGVDYYGFVFKKP